MWIAKRYRKKCGLQRDIEKNVDCKDIWKEMWIAKRYRKKCGLQEI
jgi:hypothetical protein